MTVYRIFVGKKEVGFTFNFSTAVMKVRELRSQGKNARYIAEKID